MGGGYRPTYFKKDEFMKKTILAAAALMAAGFSTNVLAQAKNFEGFSLSASTGYATWKNAASYTPSTYSGSDATTSAVPLYVGGEYTWALNDKYTLAFGAEVNLLKSSEQNQILYGNSVYADANNVKATSYNHVHIKPGMVVGKNDLVYLKLAYFNVGFESVAASDGVKDSWSNSGYSYGVGYRTEISKSIYAFGEINSLNAASKDRVYPGITINDKVNGTNFLVGLGYRF
jgi:opacity protein-like surface antigen